MTKCCGSRAASPPTLGDDALHADQVAQVAGGEGPGADVVGPEAALEPDVEVVKLFGEGGVDGGHQIFQGLLESDEFTEGILQNAAGGEHKQRDPETPLSDISDLFTFQAEYSPGWCHVVYELLVLNKIQNTNNRPVEEQWLYHLYFTVRCGLCIMRVVYTFIDLMI